MIYILEGVSGGGKTTFVNTLKGFYRKKLMLRTFDEIKAEIEANKDKNVVYDRLFMNVWLNRNDRDLEDLNYYLQHRPFVKCLGFMTDKETSFNKRMKEMYDNNIAHIPDRLKARMSEEHDRYLHVFDVMTVFEVIHNEKQTYNF